jgi:hypothetical protein
MLGLTTEEVTADWRKEHNEELHSMYLSPNIIMMIKSGKMTAEYIARMEEVRNTYKMLVSKPEVEC